MDAGLDTSIYLLIVLGGAAIIVCIGVALVYFLTLRLHRQYISIFDKKLYEEIIRRLEIKKRVVEENLRQCHDRLIHETSNQFYSGIVIGVETLRDRVLSANMIRRELVGTEEFNALAKEIIDGCKPGTTKN